LEEAVYGTVAGFLRGPEGFLAEAWRRQGLQKQTAESLRREMADLERQDREAWEAAARAFRLAARCLVTEEVFEQETGLIHTRRRWIKERRERLKAQLDDLERYSVSPEAITVLRHRLEAHLAAASPEDRRFVLDALGTQVIAHGDGHWDVQLEGPAGARS